MSFPCKGQAVSIARQRGWSLTSDSTLHLPFRDFKRVTANYLTQRDITKEYALDVSLCDREVRALEAAVTAKDTALAKCEEADVKWRTEWTDKLAELETCKRKAGSAKLWKFLEGIAVGVGVGIILAQ